MRKSLIKINTNALQHNLQQVKLNAPNSKVLSMVKANAYGHGIDECLPALTNSDGVGVASYNEALQVKQLGWTKTIVLIEGVFSEQEWLQSIKLGCQNVVHQSRQISWALNHRPNSNSASKTIWLKLNTGMNRLGFAADDILDVAKQLYDAGYKLILTSHFANADIKAHPLNRQQIELFNETLKNLKRRIDESIEASLCNSAGVLHFAECHFDWVRPGIMLYGSSPIDGADAIKFNLKPVMQFETALIAYHYIPEGAVIGYGSQYTVKQPLIKGVISTGYGDGYPRVVDNTAWVSLKQNEKIYRCPIIGRVSMDMITIDISNVPNPKLGATVVLWGDSEQGEPTVDAVANSANTIGYELLCRLTTRPTRYCIGK